MDGELVYEVHDETGGRLVEYRMTVDDGGISGVTQEVYAEGSTGEVPRGAREQVRDLVNETYGLSVPGDAL